MEKGLLMGRYLQAIKNEAIKSLPAPLRGDRQELPPPPVQPYYDEYRPPQTYGQPGSGELSPQQLQMIIAHAKLQGASEALNDAHARIEAAHHAGADRIQALALAAINRDNNIRYRGSAYDKRKRRMSEMKFLAIVFLTLGLCVLIAYMRTEPTPAPVMHKHYQHYESYDDR